ncbi:MULTISPECIES: DUF5359 family protein [unclassified Paenibacillus]|uniref:DUF5359 family protein n=1 Tax=unclassified Paenibacillus TaxID=185978 RepID=UPI001C11DEE6|nr:MULTISPECIES: DUF5359 family protein [unclassified Paenibacillus]MBU5443943.1 DUF5359 family protein [Paenibacillus sp. MSJ-34]CAH0118723.1 hypothetical protein PAE9249_01217 [Paenibacillus sp. CECT 9249]
MMRDKASERYVRLFLRFSRRVERMLLRLVIVFVCFLIAAQALLRIPALRELISAVDRLEGKPVMYRSARENNNPSPESQQFLHP